MKKILLILVIFLCLGSLVGFGQTTSYSSSPTLNNYTSIPASGNNETCNFGGTIGSVTYYANLIVIGVTGAITSDASFVYIPVTVKKGGSYSGDPFSVGGWVNFRDAICTHPNSSYNKLYGSGEVNFNDNVSQINYTVKIPFFANGSKTIVCAMSLTNGNEYYSYAITITASTPSGGTNYSISLSSNPSNGGSTSGAGTFASGSSQTVTATANTGYTFTNWKEGSTVVSTNSDYTFNLSSNRTLVANFTANAPGNNSISLSSNPTAGGTTSGGGSFTNGTSQTVTATANSGYTFSNWTENGTQVSTSASYTFTLSSNRTLVANFTTLPPASYLTLSLNSYNAPATGGLLTINVTSNVNWTATETSTWMSISSPSGTGNWSFTIDISSNPNSTSRPAETIVVSGGGITQYLTISQDPKPCNDIDGLRTCDGLSLFPINGGVPALKVGLPIVMEYNPNKITTWGQMDIINVPNVGNYNILSTNNSAFWVNGTKLTPMNVVAKSTNTRICRLDYFVSEINVLNDGVDLKGSLLFPKIFKTVSATIGNGFYLDVNQYRITQSNGVQKNIDGAVNGLFLKYLNIKKAKFKYYEIDNYIDLKVTFDICDYDLTFGGELREGKVNSVTFPIPLKFKISCIELDDFTAEVNHISDGKPILIKANASVAPVHKLLAKVLEGDIYMTFTTDLNSFSAGGSIDLFKHEVSNNNIYYNTKSGFFVTGETKFLGIFEGTGKVGLVKDFNLNPGGGGGGGTWKQNYKANQSAFEDNTVLLGNWNATISFFGAEKFNSNAFLYNNFLFGNYRNDSGNLKFYKFAYIDYFPWIVLYNDINLSSNETVLLDDISDYFSNLNIPQKVLDASNNNLQKASSMNIYDFFSIENSSKELIIKGNFSGLSHFELYTPDNKIVTETNIINFEQYTYDYISSQNSFTITIENPLCGDYAILSNNLLRDSLKIQTFKQRPSIKITNVINDLTNKTLIVEWIDSDPDNDAVICIGLDMDKENANGLVLARILENENTNSLNIVYGDSIKTGSYYLFAFINDTLTMPAFDYFDVPVFVHNSILNPPTNINYQLKDTCILFTWTNTNPGKFIEYNMYFSNESNTVNYFSQSASIGNFDTLYFNHDNPGKYFEFIFTAKDTLGNESRPSDVIQLNWISNTLNNTPYIPVQEFNEIAYVGNSYSYQLIANDADNEQLYYNIVKGPTGLQISNTGFIMWTPTNDQKSYNSIYIEVSDINGLKDSCNFQICVNDITSSKAALDFSKIIYQDYNENPILYLNDDDKFSSKNERETYNCRVFSTSDPIGINLTLSETSISSKEYMFYFKLTQNSSYENYLKVAVGDTIWAVYQDDYPNVKVKEFAYFSEFKADFKIPTSVCEGDSILFINKSSGSGMKYSWNFGDGNTNDKRHAYHVFNTTDGSGFETFNVTLTISDDEGRSSTITKPVNIYKKPAVDLGTDIEVCDYAKLDANNAGATFFWNTGEETQRIKVYETGLYDVSVTNVFGCVNTDQINVTVHPLPTPDFEYPDYVCFKDVITLNGNYNNVGIFTGSGIAGNVYNSAVAGVGFNIVKYTYTDEFGCTDSIKHTLEVKPLPQPNVLAYDNTICVNGGNVLIPPSITGSTFNGIGLSSAGELNPTIAGVGIQTSRVFFTDQYGCTNYKEFNYEILAPPAVEFAGLQTSYCRTREGNILTGVPVGGHFVGDNITYLGHSQVYFETDISGIFEVNYIYTDPNTQCTNNIIHSAIIRELPTPEFELQSYVCSQDEILPLSGNYNNYGYFFGNGVTGFSFNNEITGVGFFDIGYTYTDLYGCSDSIIHQIEVKALPEPEVLAFDNSVCINAGNVNLTPTISGSYFTGDGLTEDGILNPIAAGLGLHTANVTVTDEFGCTGTNEFTYEILQIPMVEYSGLASTYCNNSEPTVLTGSPLTGIFNGYGIYGNQFMPAMVQPGSYTITYTYQDPITQCANTVSHNTVVSEIPMVSLTAEQTTICEQSEPVILNVEPVNGLFSGSGIANPTEGVFYSELAVIGINTINYQFTNLEGCTNTVSLDINMVVYADAQITGNLEICEGEITTLNASGGNTFLWDNNSTSPELEVSPTENTVYTVTVSNFGICSDIAITEVIVNPKPEMPVIENNGMLLFTNSQADSYQWNFENSEILGATNNMYLATEYGTYNVSIFNENNCTNSSNDFELSSLNTLSEKNNLIKLYPNPNNGIFKIEIQESLTTDIKSIVYSGTGAEIYSNNYNNNILDFDLQSLSSGVYFVKLEYNSKISIIIFSKK